MTAPAGAEPTADSTVFIEDRRPGYIRYVQTSGRHWEVFGECVKLGYCMIGAVVGDPPAELANLDAAQTFVEANPFQLDVPVTPEFNGCCSFTYNEMAPIEPFEP